MRRALPVLIGLLMISPAVLSEQFYKWQDEKGVWHFSAQKPKDQPAEKLKVRVAATQSTDDSDEDGDTDKAKAIADESPNCKAARANLEVLNSSALVAKDIDGDGEAENLTLEQHQEEIALAEQQKSAFCKPDKPVAEEAEEDVTE